MKCMTMIEYMSSVFSVLTSLPFMCGFPNETWHHVTDIILGKKPGMGQIHTAIFI